jgi:hypothetical protein
MWVRCAAVQVTRADCATPRPPTPHAPAIVHGFAPDPDIISGAAAISDYMHQLQVTQSVGVCALSPLTTVAEHAKAAAAVHCLPTCTVTRTRRGACASWAGASRHDFGENASMPCYAASELLW